MLSSSVLGWQEIANTLAHMIIQAQAWANSSSKLMFDDVENSIAPKEKAGVGDSRTLRPKDSVLHSIGGSSALETPGSVNSEVLSIGSLETGWILTAVSLGIAEAISVVNGSPDSLLLLILL